LTEEVRIKDEELTALKAELAKKKKQLDLAVTSEDPQLAEVHQIQLIIL
jgi:hypothetical protein